MFKFIGRNKRGAMLSYFKIFISFVAIVMAANIALSVAMYMNYERHSVKLVRTYTAEELTKISYSTSFMFEAAKMTLMQLYANPSVIKLMNQRDLGELETASLLRQVSVVNVNLPFVNSIFIYNKRADRIYFDGKAFSVGAFPDRDMVSRLEEGGIASLRPVARTIPTPAGYTNTPAELFETDDVYSFAFFDRGSSTIDNAIVLNVSQEWLMSTIESMAPEVTGHTLVVDSAGLIVLGNERYGYLTRMTDYAELVDLSRSDAPSDYSIQSIDGQKYLVTYVDSPISDWKYVKLTPYDAVSGKLKQLVVWTLLIFVVVTLLSVLAVMYISKFVYGLFNREIRELENKYDREKHAGYEKKQQFLRMLATRPMEEGIVRKRLARYGIHFKPDLGFTTIVFKIDRYRQFVDQYSLEDRSLLSYGIMNVMGELAKPHYANETVDLGEGCIGMILHLDVQNSEDLAVKLEGLVKDVQDKVAEFLGVSLSASLGEGLEEIAEIPASVGLCLEAMEYKLFYGPRSLMYVSVIKEIGKQDQVFPEQSVTEIIEALLAEDGEAIRQSCRRLIEGTRGYSLASLQSTVLRLAFSLKDGLRKYPMLAGEVHYGPFIEMAGRVNGFETLDELIDQLNELFEGLLDVVLRAQKEVRKYERYSDILGQVQSFVEQDYANPGLNPDMIAQRFELSAKYLRTLYLKASGESLGDYITRYRLDRAKSLLEDETITVQEAAARSGFLNINYFYTLFKKYNGITPTEFRSLSGSERR